MKTERLITISEDWSKNWHDKIAVRITSIVLWSLTFFSMLFASLLISQVREKTELEQNRLIDQLSYLVMNQIYSDTKNLSKNLGKASESILENNDFSQIDILYDNHHFTFGQADELDTTITRDFNSPLNLSIITSLTPIQLSVRNRQIQIFMIFSISLVSLGAFLGFNYSQICSTTVSEA